MSQHNLHPNDGGSQDHITHDHETTEQKAARLAQARADSGREHMEAVAAMAAAPKNYPTPVDEAAANSPRVFPTGPREHGAVGGGRFHPSPTLDPRNAELLDGYEEFGEDLLPLQRCLSNAFNGLTAINAAREKLRNDPTVTAGAAVVRLVAEAERKHQHILDTFSKTEERLRTTERALERSLHAPVVQNAGLGTVNGEIRDHVKGLDTGKRHKLIEDAFAKRDESTLVAICGAPAFLSGLDDAAHALYLRRLQEMREPVTTRRLKSVRTAITLMERAIPIAMTSVEKALGSSFSRAKNLKATSDASDAALKAIMGSQE